MNKIKYAILKKFWESVYNTKDDGYLFSNYVGCRDFLLDGKYSYNQVLKLNELTDGNVSFGFCKDLGNVAFIGIIDDKNINDSGIFRYNVPVYGKPVNNDKCFFDHYYDFEARKHNNYIVYGYGDPRMLQGKAPIFKVNYFYDYRYLSKNEFSKNFDSSVLDMEVKLIGKYSYDGAKRIACVTIDCLKNTSSEVAPIQFGLVDGIEPVAIIGLLNCYDNASFRDVWGKGESEPSNQSITFLSESEAKKIDNFKLYYFKPVQFFNKNLIEKVDRYLDDNFNFNIEGTDYRLKDFNNSNVKSLKLYNRNL